MKSSSSLYLLGQIALLVSNIPIEARRHQHHLTHLQTREFFAHSNANSLESKDEDYESISNSTQTGRLAFHGHIHKSRENCQFPSDAGLVPVTPDANNAGWAMSPDQSCQPGSYCPYACPSGQVMAQWNPDATAYTYPESMDGGLHCDKNGIIKKPFPEKPYCESGTGVVTAHNKIGKEVSFCQTVLPGNEAMLIPTHVEEKSDLAVPGEDYWCKTAAHYYINPPGVKSHQACVWGDGSESIGNWSPYVAGANTDGSGQTFVKIGWNPIYTGSKLASTAPDFGIRISCEKGNCNGTPCSIDPSSHGVGGVESDNKATGAGGADFCVVTVPKGGKANIEVFSTDKSSGPPHENAPETKSSDSKSSGKENPELNILSPEPTHKEVETGKQTAVPPTPNNSGGSASNNNDNTETDKSPMSGHSTPQSEDDETDSTCCAQPFPKSKNLKTEEIAQISSTPTPKIRSGDHDLKISETSGKGDISNEPHSANGSGQVSQGHGANQVTTTPKSTVQSNEVSSGEAPSQLFEVNEDITLSAPGTKHVAANNDSPENDANSFASSNNLSTNFICSLALIMFSLIFFSL